MEPRRSHIFVAASFLCSVVLPVHAASQGGQLDPVGQMARQNTAFALELYHSLAAEEGNLLVAPHSLSVAMAMTYAGAREETARQIAEVLHFDNPDTLHPEMADLHTSLETLHRDGTILNLANALWAQEGYGLLDEFIAINREHYGAAVTEVDFLGHATAARHRINRWVAEQTERRIDSLLEPADITPPTTLVLTSAMYFSGRWASRFDPTQTKEGAFITASDTGATAEFMHQLGMFGYAELDGVRLVELPYQDGRLSMVVLLPDELDGLAELERSLTPDKLDGWLQGLRDQPVLVTLPRFVIADRRDLMRTFQSMGMTDPFSGAADFSGMTGQRDLFISAIVHQAEVEVDERGTEASGASAVILKRGAPTEFTADHPFIFLIQDSQSGAILLLGRVVQP